MESAVAFAATVAVLGPLCQKITERLRLVTHLNGSWVSLLALVVGTGLAYAFSVDISGVCVPTREGTCLGLRDFPSFIDWIIGGAAISSWAGYLADRAGRSNASVTVGPIE